jgi:hypothetical protein
MRRPSLRHGVLIPVLAVLLLAPVLRPRAGGHVPAARYEVTDLGTLAAASAKRARQRARPAGGSVTPRPPSGARRTRTRAFL